MIGTIVILACIAIASMAIQRHRDREHRLVGEPAIAAVEVPPDSAAETRPDARRTWRSEQLAKIVAKRKASS